MELNANDLGAWVEEFAGAVTVCDKAGVILAMNARSAALFADYGGAALIGRNLLDCHPEPARTRLRELLAGQRANVYTTEKRGVKRLIYQSPWYRGGEYMGLVELGLELPAELPHFVRG
jgi:transcriptional regulator with PAS, ATPase and Fis domain